MLIVYVILFLPLVSSFIFQPNSSRQSCTYTSRTCKSNKDGLTIATRLHAAAVAASNLNKDGKCKFGTKEYWDTMYNGEDSNTNDDGLSAEEYSWYCGYQELQPFWDMLVAPLISSVTDTDVENNDNDEEHDVMNKKRVKVLIAGIGNDITPIQMYDDGWTNMIAFDYSESGVSRAQELFGPTRLHRNDDTNNDDSTTGAKLLVADCRELLTIPNGTINATLDKGTLDAIYITGKEVFLDSVKELTRVTAKNGIIVCVSAVIPQEELLDAFVEESDDSCWETVLDGGLAFADGGEATIDLGANLYSFRRR